MFTARDLEVYKDSLKEKNNKTTTAETPAAKTPPPVARVPKPPLKPTNEESHKERKPLSVVHKVSSNTIKDPQRTHSATPVGSSKQGDQWRKMKEAVSKNPLPGKIHTAEVNSLVKPSEFKTEPLKSPRGALPPKSPHAKLDDSKASGVRKAAALASPVKPKSPSLSGTKAPPTFANASLCSECTRSASEGAVCFIGNDGRVSACTTRSAVRLCKNLNCAANNPEYVAAMANAPKKYLISKRHLLKAQYGPKSKTCRPKSPNLYQTDATENGRMTPSQDSVSPAYADTSGANSSASETDDFDLSLLEGSLKEFDEELNLLDGNLAFDKDGMDLRTDGMYSIEDSAVEEPIDFSFHDGEAAEAESPKLLGVESPKDFNGMHLVANSGNFQEDTGASDNLQEDAESLVIDNLEEHDEEDLDESPMHRESKAEELLIIYGDLMSSEEVDIDDHSGNAAGFCQPENNYDVSIAHGVANALQTVGCENAGECAQVGNRSSNGESSQESDREPATSGAQAVMDLLSVDGITPFVEGKQLDENNDGCDTSSVAGQLADDVKSGDWATTCDALLAGKDENDSNIDDSQSIAERKSGDSTTTNGTPIANLGNQKGRDIGDGLEDRGDLISPSIADNHQDNSTPLLVGHNGLSGVSSLNDTQVLHGSEYEQRDDDTKSGYDKRPEEDDEWSSRHDNLQVEEEDQSDGDYSDEEQPNAIINNSISIEENANGDTHKGMEHLLNEWSSKGQDGNRGNNSAQRQRRRRVLTIPEEVSPEMVILRKQQMLERKQAEEWLLNHAIEGVVHKLAPTGEAKVKILVEAFESIISHKDVESIDTHNPRQEKRTATA